MATPDASKEDNTSPNAKNKRVAVLKHPLIEAVIHGLFKFTEERQAVARLNEIKSKFIVGKDQDPSGRTLKLWIKDYELSDEDIKKGYRGHFGEISIKQLDKRKCSLHLAKLDVPLAAHPQKTRAKRSHPDWGHPVLRKLEKYPVFKEPEHAHALLMTLHEEYPNISIPGLNYLLIMVYRKDKVKKGDGPPVQKLKFSIVAAEGGGYKITWAENVKRQKVTIKKEEPEVAQPTVGSFTAMVKLKKKRKPSDK